MFLYSQGLLKKSDSDDMEQATAVRPRDDARRKGMLSKRGNAHQERQQFRLSVTAKFSDTQVKNISILR